MVLSETGVAAGVRRIEAVVGKAAEEVVIETRDLLRQAAARLKTELPRVPERIGVLQASVKTLRKDLERAQSEGGGTDLNALLTKRTVMETFR